ncbi:MAG TPA: carbohydrate ABC transporter permease [Clostridia bacterium]
MRDSEKSSILYKRKGKSKVVFAIVFVFFFIYALALLVPFAYGFMISLKENGRAFMRDPVSITFPLYFSNYIKAFRSLKLGNIDYFMMIINSLWYSAGSTFFTLAACTCTAYVVSKYNFKGRNFIYNAALVVMMIPIYGALPAQYRLYSKMGLIDSPLILITSFGGFGTYFFYIYAFFKSIPWSYAEAAFIDGAGNLRTFLSIMLPMLMPSLSALAVMNFVGLWNDYAGPIIWLPNLPPLASGLYTYEFNMRYEANQPVYFAGVIISIIPVLAIFIAFQNTIMTKVYAGGLKG